MFFLSLRVCVCMFVRVLAGLSLGTLRGQCAVRAHPGDRQGAAHAEGPQVEGKLRRQLKRG